MTTRANYQQTQDPIRRVDLVHHATLDSKDKKDPYKYGEGVEARPYRYGFASVDRAIEHQERRKAKADEVAAAEQANAQRPSATIETNNSDRLSRHEDDYVNAEDQVTAINSVSNKVKSSSSSASASGSVRRVDLIHTVFDAPNKDENSGRIGYIPSVDRKLRFQQTKEDASTHDNNDGADHNSKPPRLVDDLFGCLDPTKHTVPSDEMYNTRHKRDDVIAPNGGASGVAPDAAYRF